MGVEAINVKQMTLYKLSNMCGLPALGPCSGTQLYVEEKQYENAGQMERLDAIRLPALSLNQFRLHRA